MKEGTTLHVSIKLYPGRSEEQKIRLAEQLVKDVITLANCREESVSATIEEVQADDWTEQVYKPDILRNREKLYKKPGYKPLQ